MSLLRLSLVSIACGAAVFAQARADDLTTQLPQPPRTSKAKAPKPAKLAPSQAGDLSSIKFSNPYAPPEGDHGREEKPASGRLVPVPGADGAERRPVAHGGLGRGWTQVRLLSADVVDGLARRLARTDQRSGTIRHETGECRKQRVHEPLASKLRLDCLRRGRLYAGARGRSRGPATEPPPTSGPKAKAPKPAKPAQSQADGLGAVKFSNPYAPPEGAGKATGGDFSAARTATPVDPKGGVSFTYKWHAPTSPWTPIGTCETRAPTLRAARSWAD